VTLKGNLLWVRTFDTVEELRLFSQALTKAHELGADMLVMGAYAHSPLREALLGGVTRHMLAHADLTVLMRH
jgi:nucleotide-binding universal stress UspA family protein